jgi:hypothetical protein
VIGRARPYYIAPVYPLLMAGGAVALEAWLPRLAKPVLAALVAAVAVVTAPMFLPVQRGPQLHMTSSRMYSARNHSNLRVTPVWS